MYDHRLARVCLRAKVFSTTCPAGANFTLGNYLHKLLGGEMRLAVYFLLHTAWHGAGPPFVPPSDRAWPGAKVNSPAPVAPQFSILAPLRLRPWHVRAVAAQRPHLDEPQPCPSTRACAGEHVTRSVRAQVLVYASLVCCSAWARSAAAFWYWLLPLALGQPVLWGQFIAQHSGCDFRPQEDDSGFDVDGRYSRTTITNSARHTHSTRWLRTYCAHGMIPAWLAHAWPSCGAASKPCSRLLLRRPR